jgi:hypothetical protein
VRVLETGEAAESLREFAADGRWFRLSAARAGDSVGVTASDGTGACRPSGCSPLARGAGDARRRPLALSQLARAALPYLGARGADTRALAASEDAEGDGALAAAARWRPRDERGA